MKILVTGGAGFIGSHLIEALLDQRHSVVCLDSLDPFYDIKLKKENLKLFKDHVRFQFVKGDIRNKKTLSNLFLKNRFQACIHLAARAGVRPSIQDPVLYADVNVNGTLNLLEEARIHQLDHFIFASSSSVYGRRNGVPFSEEDALLSPVSPYAATKISGEALCHVYHDLYKIRMSVLRFFTVYGPRQRPEMAIHKFTRAIHEGKPLTLFGDGNTSRDYTFISDIVQGILSVLNGKWAYEIFNLGDSKTISLIELVRLIEANLKKKAKIQWMKDQAGDVPITCADISKAKKLLKYDVKVPIEDGIRFFCEWFLER